MLDTIHTLPSGTELSIEAAIGDLSRAREFFLSADADDQDSQGMASDLEHVAELLTLIAERMPDADS